MVVTLLPPLAGTVSVVSWFAPHGVALLSMQYVTPSLSKKFATVAFVEPPAVVKLVVVSERAGAGTLTCELAELVAPCQL